MRTDLEAAFGPKRVFSSIEWVMKLISKKKASMHLVNIVAPMSAGQVGMGRFRLAK
jgi:hypothetical protein